MLSRSLLLFFIFLRTVSSLVLLFPTNPTFGEQFSVRWNSGVPPFNLQVINMNNSMPVFTYSGSENITWWTVNVPAGTVITFQITDGAGDEVTSAMLTVLDPINTAASMASLLSLSSVALLSSQSTASLSSMMSISSVSSVSVLSTATISPAALTTTSMALPSQTSPTTPPRPTKNTKSKNAIIGGAAGGVVLILLFGGTLFACSKRHGKSSRRGAYAAVDGRDEDLRKEGRDWLSRLRRSKIDTDLPLGGRIPGRIVLDTPAMTPMHSSYPQDRQAHQQEVSEPLTRISEESPFADSLDSSHYQPPQSYSDVQHMQHDSPQQLQHQQLAPHRQQYIPTQFAPGTPAPSFFAPLDPMPVPVRSASPPLPSMPLGFTVASHIEYSRPPVPPVAPGTPPFTATRDLPLNSTPNSAPQSRSQTLSQGH